MSNPKDYSVGWICAITTEYVAAQEFLDEEHDEPEYVSPNDNNHYTLGRVGRHNVVIAVLPDNEYGKSSAASVARDMLHSFPNVRIGLMVGIGGGAPGQHDIRLGDVVVSSATSNGGVLGYDFGKDVQGHDFQVTGFLNQPPTLLRTAMSGLKARYERKGHQLTEAVNAILNQNKRLRKKYKQPEIATDQLFKSAATHDMVCAVECCYDGSNLVSRPERDEDEDHPAIHYGLIASADKLMKNASARDMLSEAHDVLCFEMEAAGLMNHFPCLVIRGICDYADSHKNKEWQGYAAMIAAAYTKDLLNQIAPNKVEAEMKIRDFLSGFQEIAKEHRDIAREQLQAQKDQAKDRLSEEQQQCHQLFRLTTSSKDATYEWYKGRVEERTEGTCMWFLRHNHFQTWLGQESGPLLVSADPGCGKSVLAKYLIDHGLPRSATICYFFFQDRDQNTVRQALCALLHQLFSLKPALIDHAMPLFRKDGQGLIHSTASLWQILHNAIQDPQTGSIIIVLDALDECVESELADLIQNVDAQFHRDQTGYGKLKYLLTCRPYIQILSRFHNLLHALPEIHIPGEEESETIAQEVNHVIRRRIDQLAMKKRFPTHIKSHLEKKLQAAPHRTYLWVYLVFDYLQKEDFKRTVKGIDFAIAALPTTVNKAYEQILNKTHKGPMVLKVLSIMLAASRPLTLSEMNVAVNLDDKCLSIGDLDLEDDEDFKRRLRSWCGLFVSIHQGSIYFLHQTAREFLLADLQSPRNIESGLHWHKSITSTHAHYVLVNICVLYLYLLLSYNTLMDGREAQTSQDVDRNSFLIYSAENWIVHFHSADIADSDTILPLVRRICDTSSKAYPLWFDIYAQSQSLMSPSENTDLVISSILSHSFVSELFHEVGINIRSRNKFRFLISLSWAARKGNDAVAKLLLEEGAAFDLKVCGFDKTPLYIAAEIGHETFVELLLEKGANVNLQLCDFEETLLYVNAKKAYETFIDIFFKEGWATDVKLPGFEEEIICIAGKRAHETVVELLINKDADVKTKDGIRRQTPLHMAALRGENLTIKLLIESGADIEEQDAKGWTPLFSAIHEDRETTVELLLEEGANMNFINSYDRSPLEVAATDYNVAIIKLLVENGAYLEHDNIHGMCTPLIWASKNGDEAMVRLLLENGAIIGSRNKHGQTALLWAYTERHDAIVDLLIERGAEFDQEEKA